MRKYDNLMRRVAILGCLLLGIAPASSAEPSASSSAAKPTLAVVDFAVRGEVGLADAGAAVAELLVSHLGQGRYELIERSQLARLLDEAHLSMALLRDQPQPAYQKLKKVRFLVLGSVIKFGDLTVTARIVDAASGSIVRTGQVSAEDARGLKVALGDLGRTLLSADAAGPRPEIRVTTQLTGRVVQIRGRYGQAVRKGDILVRLDDRDMQTQAMVAESQARAAAAELQQAQTGLKRTRSLLAAGAAAAKDIEAAQSAVQRAQARHAFQRAAADVAKANLDKCVITSPVDGTIVDMPTDEKRFEVGHMVRAGEVVVVIAAQPRS